MTLLASGGQALAQLRIVTYNTSGNVAGSGGAMAAVMKGIGDESRNGIQRPLDIVSVQEQDLSLASTKLVVNALNSLYGAGTYASSTISGTGDSTQAVVYNTKTVELVSQQAFLTTSSSAAPRQPLRFQFRPVGYGANADFYVYSAHPKASNDTTSAARRGIEAAGIRANADALGSGVRAIYTGDFNTYNSTESFITNMTAAGGAGQAFDPINRLGAWSNNGAFADVHTQSPVLASGAYYDYQVGGGMDDRFDFQLVTAPILSGHGVSYINGTYHAFGNAGLQFNKDITATGAAAALAQYFPGYSTSQVQSILAAIAQNSDHLPVVADYRLPAKMAVTATAAVPDRIITGGSVGVGLTVANVAPVSSASAADSLDYTATLSGSATLKQAGTIAATAAAQSRTFALDTTSALGERTATLNVTSSSPGVADGSSSTSYHYTVLAHSTPSLLADAQATSAKTDLGVVAIGRSSESGVAVYNLADLSGYTARLNVTGTGVAGDAAIGATLANGTNIDAGTGRAVTISFAPTAFGAVSSTLAIATADEDLPGATARDTLSLSIAGFGAYAGDANLTNTIDFDDLLALARHYDLASGASWADGDFDASGSVNFDDLLALGKNYGFNGNAGTQSSVSFEQDWALAQSLVPEPTMLLGLVGLGVMGGTRRRR